MAYRFRRKDRTVEHALRRIAREQVDKAISAIDDSEGDSAATIHDVRKRCKKLRGLVRLVGPSFAAYSDENVDFREIGQLLGGLREARVLKDTFDQLAERYEQVDPQSRKRFRRGLQTRPQIDQGSERLAEARQRLAVARERIGDWTLAADGWAAIGPGLMRTAIRARAALDRIGGSHAPKLHHELRKQVKYHWHHMRLLRPIAPKEIKPRADLAAELSDHLGEHHDLAVLDTTFRAEPGAFGAERDVEATLVLARRHRVLLEEQSLRLARRLLAESPESLTERFGREWMAWRG